MNKELAKAHQIRHKAYYNATKTYQRELAFIIKKLDIAGYAATNFDTTYIWSGNRLYKQYRKMRNQLEIDYTKTLDKSELAYSKTATKLMGKK